MLRRNECVPILILLGLSIALTFKAEPLLRYTQDTAKLLGEPSHYVMAVFAAKAHPGPSSDDGPALAGETP